MPTVEQNRASWDRDYAWPQQGDEWSVAWGGPDMQWYSTLLPRLHLYLPAANILEIAPGFGRWTTYLKDRCEHLTVVDLSEKCIEACQERFANSTHISYFVNDGKDLSMLTERTFDLVFSFDSLVHAEAEIFEAYLPQLARVLKPDGVGFIHHSNSGSYRSLLSFSERFRWRRLGWPLRKLKVIELSTHWRSLSMTSERFEEIAAATNLACISQETVDWDTSKHLLIDCISVFTPRGSKYERPNRRYSNVGFMTEVKNTRALADLYGEAGSRAR